MIGAKLGTGALAGSAFAVADGELVVTGFTEA
jgi:hypothetical protein